ncbi:MarR family winged helix-turn-helix transcriptional regulator [Fulvivirga sedimenti]|uniref:MarR family winged helix-turn-helix transcriptional regulator n=1 Tax=Fulvivirga sedimenti TaxID=2879465 RepID=A0A9X1HZC5_9BACT|nr:MarR family winged helix-turn-helix transcriptional regulator [Fulvivirga sedimenti]MCA6079214.1 MarR family winged helix-turn-helix transcriptional regulator [Fulvivirga sedimenti]
MKDPGSLGNNVLYLAGHITKTIHNQLTAAFAANQIPLTVEQFSLLSTLWYNDGMNQQSLAAALNRDKTTIARMVQIMEKNDLLVKVADKTDLRNKLIYTTNKGKKLQEKAVALAGQLYIRALEGLDESSLSKTVQLLQNIHKNLIS